MKVLTLSLVLIFITSLISGQTIIPGGFVSGTWQASQSPFHIQGNIEINYDSTLIIEPGVDIYFDGSYMLTINGRLDASGTITDSVRFIASFDSIGWKGIYFYQINTSLDSSCLKYCSITKAKKTNDEGGALYIYQSDKIYIDHCRISNNSSFHEAGGIQIEEGDIVLKNSLIQGNTSESGTGGIECFFSDPYFSDLTITNNSSGMVGGLYFYSNPAATVPHFKRLNILHNKGDGIGGLALQFATNVILDQCNISYNEGDYCGGIGLYDNSYFSDSVPGGRNSVYFNKGGNANDLYIDNYETINVYIDTFSVSIPDNYHVYPKSSFIFIEGIQYGFINPVDTNLYISVQGSDENDGFSVENPLRSFNYALRLIKENPDSPNTLWVTPGTYHLTESDSGSSIYLKDNTLIKALQNNQVIIDGDSTTRVFTGVNVINFQISGLTINNGYSTSDGGGILLAYSRGKIDSCIFDSNKAEDNGGGVFCEWSGLSFNSCTLSNNTGDWGGGVYVKASGPNGFTLNDCDFIENVSNGWGGGLHAESEHLRIINCRFISNQCLSFGGGASFFGADNPLLINCGFYINEALNGAGGLLLDFTSTDGNFINCTFSDNISPEGSAMIIAESGPIQIINSIFWNSSVSSSDLIHLYDLEEEDSTILIIDHSDIQGGETSIILEEGNILVDWQENNLIVTPEFIDPVNGDYSLNWNSPCIEAGKEDTTGLNLPETDLNGDPRIVNARIDMGAIEFQFPVSSLTLQPNISNINIYHDLQNIDLIIEFPENLTDKSLSIRLISMEGLEIKAKTKPQGIDYINLPVPEISSGIYLVTISDGGKIIYSRKILIIN